MKPGDAQQGTATCKAEQRARNAETERGLGYKQSSESCRVKEHLGGTGLVDARAEVGRIAAERDLTDARRHTEIRTCVGRVRVSKWIDTHVELGQELVHARDEALRPRGGRGAAGLAAEHNHLDRAQGFANERVSESMQYALDWSWRSA